MKRENKRFLLEVDGTTDVDGVKLYVSLYDKKEEYYPIVESYNLQKTVDGEYKQLGLSTPISEKVYHQFSSMFVKRGLKLIAEAKTTDERLLERKSKCISWTSLLDMTVRAYPDPLDPSSYPDELVRNSWRG